MKIQYVPLEWVNYTWDKVEGFISSALEYADGDYTTDQVRTLVTLGQWSLIVAVSDDGEIQGAATVSFVNRPSDRVAFVTTISGNLISSVETFQQLKDYAKSMGATAIEGAARESIARLWQRYGFKEKYRIVGVKL
jgi:hypothetical protein